MNSPLNYIKKIANYYLTLLFLILLGFLAGTYLNLSGDKIINFSLLTDNTIFIEQINFLTIHLALLFAFFMISSIIFIALLSLIDLIFKIKSVEKLDYIFYKATLTNFKFTLIQIFELLIVLLVFSVGFTNGILINGL